MEFVNDINRSIWIIVGMINILQETKDKLKTNSL